VYRNILVSKYLLDFLLKDVYVRMKFREKGISSILRKKVRAFKLYPKNRTCP